MPLKFIISENDVVIAKDSTISQTYKRLAVVESIIVSKDNKMRGAKVTISNSNTLDWRLICFTWLRPLICSPLKKGNEPEVSFVVNTGDFCFNKTVLKNDNVTKPNVVI